TQNSDGARFCIQCQFFFKPDVRKCPNGHTMDSTWVECFYCKSQAESTGDVSSGAGEAPKPASVGAFDDRTTRRVAEIETGPRPDPHLPRTTLLPPALPKVAPDPRKRRVTEFVSPGDAQARSAASEESAHFAPATSMRKIVGVLVTYTWKPQG